MCVCDRSLLIDIHYNVRKIWISKYFVKIRFNLKHGRIFKFYGIFLFFYKHLIFLVVNLTVDSSTWLLKNMP